MDASQYKDYGLTLLFVKYVSDKYAGKRHAMIEKHYLKWREDKVAAEGLDEQLAQLCEPERFLEVIHDFIVFDAGVKKVCRHNQYFGVHAAQERVRRREGGIIWHTQGSGKSLTMVWLAKWIRENVPGSRVLIVTDRTELDEQIEKVFKGVDEDIYRTQSGTDLISKLNATEPWLLCSLVHKFGGGDTATAQDFAQKLKDNLPRDFEVKGELFVFVDECHRTQADKLHEAMTGILPAATFIGFTGTLLLKSDKQKSVEIFGTYIHTYKYDEAVGDGAVLDLRYEARDIDQSLTSPERVDQWLEAKTSGLTNAARMQLKKKWRTMQKGPRRDGRRPGGYRRAFHTKGRLARQPLQGEGSAEHRAGGAVRVRDAGGGDLRDRKEPA